MYFVIVKLKFTLYYILNRDILIVFVYALKKYTYFDVLLTNI